MPAEKISTTYRVAMTACSPIVRAWGRLEVEGLDVLPAEGPVLLAGNHDSYWDPVAVGVAQLPRRQVRALAKSSMWKVKGLNKVLDGMGQIPIVRGSADVGALDRAIAELRAGACIGVFPEGTRSLGHRLGEPPVDFVVRLLEELRAEAPRVAAGRRAVPATT